MGVIFIVLIITILANLILGWSTFRGQSHSASALVFLFIIASIISWTTSKIFFYYAGVDFVNRISIPMLYISGAAIATTFLLFSNTFPNAKFVFDRKFYAIILPVPLMFLVLLIFSDLIVGNVIEIKSVRGVSLGKMYFAYALFIAIYFVFGHIILFRRFLRSTGIMRVQFIYVLLGSSIASFGGMITNVLLPWIGNFHLYWLGPPLTIVMVVLYSYSIVKHHLLNIRVITTELFTAFILVIMLFNTLLSESPSEFIINSSMFFFVLLFGVFLIRGTLREIRELERLSKTKSDFVSIVSHQLRTPLTTIKGFVSMIKEGSGSEEDRKDWLDKTYTTNERMIRLVNDILNVSRIERGKLQYDFKEIDIIKLVDGIVSEMQVQAGEKGLELKWEKPASAMPDIRADEEKLRQVVLNLIDNAIHYTDKGYVSVKLIYSKGLGKVQIIVRDTGVGMTKEDMKNLFEQFSRGEKSRKSNVEGMGLGLYVASSIVRAHNGKIWAQSEGPHKGSRFYIELPVE